MYAVTTNKIVNSKENKWQISQWFTMPDCKDIICYYLRCYGPHVDTFVKKSTLYSRYFQHFRILKVYNILQTKINVFGGREGELRVNFKKKSSRIRALTYRQVLIALNKFVLRYKASWFWGKILYLYLSVYFDRENVRHNMSLLDYICALHV